MTAILSILLSGVMVGLLCYALLQARQKQSQQSKVKARFFTGEATSAGRATSLPKKQGADKHASYMRTHQSTTSAASKANMRLRAILAALPFLNRMQEKQARELRRLRAEAELPRLFDILAMGMQSGLSFDASFGLYAYRFESELALVCRERLELWERGLISRSEGLKQLSELIDLPLFERFCRMANRSVRYGVPMTPLIREYAQQARTEYRNKQKEKVLKAPVKMLLPTGVLILPAMMLLVLGPMLLDLTGRMV